QRSNKAGPKAAPKFHAHHHFQHSTDSGRPAPGGVGAPHAAAAAAAGLGAPTAAGGGGGGAGGAANTTARGESTPKLTASALQHLQPTIPSPALAAFEARDLTEGLPSAAKQSMYWGPVKPPTPRIGGSGGGGAARERSHTEESRARPPPVEARARTGSIGAASSAEMVLERAGSGGGGSGGRGGGGAEEAGHGFSGSTAAAAIRSAMTLLRNDSMASKDTAPNTTSSLGSRVFRTFSSVSSGGARGGGGGGGGGGEAGRTMQATGQQQQQQQQHKGGSAAATVLSDNQRGGGAAAAAADGLPSQGKRMMFGSRSDRNLQGTAPPVSKIAAAPAAAAATAAAGPAVASSSARSAQQGSVQQPPQRRAITPPPQPQPQQALHPATSARAAQAQQAAAARLRNLEEEKAQARGQARAQAERAKAEKAEKEAQERALMEEQAFVEAYSASAAAEAEQQAVTLKLARAEAANAVAQADREAKARAAAQSSQAVAAAAARAQERQRQELADAEAAEARKRALVLETRVAEDRRRAALPAEQQRTGVAVGAVAPATARAREEAEARRLRAEFEAKRARERRDASEKQERERREREREEAKATRERDAQAEKEREAQLESERKEQERRDLERDRQLQQQKEVNESWERERRRKEEQNKAKASPSTASFIDLLSASSKTSWETGARPSMNQSGTAVGRGAGAGAGFFAASPVGDIPPFRGELPPAVGSPEAASIPTLAAIEAHSSASGDASATAGGIAAVVSPRPPEENGEISQLAGSRSVEPSAAATAAPSTVPAVAGSGAAPAAAVEAGTTTKDVADGGGALEVSIRAKDGVVAAAAAAELPEEVATAAVLDAPPPLTQAERDENILRAHLASWRFCFHEAAALLTPVLGAGYVETPNGTVGGGGGGGRNGGDSGPVGGGFLVSPSTEEVDLHSELWAKLVQAEALMLQTMLSVSSGANKDTMAACEAVSEALEVSLPPSRSRDTVRDDIAFKLAAAAEVTRSSRPDGSSSASQDAYEAVSLPPTLAEQSLLMELEVLMVRVAMQLMAGHMLKAATSTRKFLKTSNWLLKAKDTDFKTAKRARDKAAAAAASSGVGIIQSFFFKQKAPAPAPARPAAAVAAGRGSTRTVNGKVNGDLANGRNRSDSGRSGPSRFSNGCAPGAADEESHRLIEGAVPTEFAGRDWVGYLHHVDFIVALMHVGTSLMPKGLVKLIEHVVGYTPSFDKGLSLLSGCCSTKGMRRPCAVAVLELLVFREVRYGTRYGAGGGGGAEAEMMARAVALDNAQGALESFYASFPVVPLLSVAHAKALQTSGEYEEAYDLCLMAQKVVDESVEKGDGMGPAHDPHVLWLQLAFSSFFLQRWSRALDVFTRIVEGVTQQACENDKRGLTGFSAAYAAASMCGVQPVEQGEVHKLIDV
ncbi:unnamed protein product, partial [Ectocarpus sp. 12 AP-2014]